MLRSTKMPTFEVQARPHVTELSRVEFSGVRRPFHLRYLACYPLVYACMTRRKKFRSVSSSLPTDQVREYSIAIRTHWLMLRLSLHARGPPTAPWLPLSLLYRWTSYPCVGLPLPHTQPTESTIPPLQADLNLTWTCTCDVPRLLGPRC